MQMLMLYFQVTTTINQALIVHAGSKLGFLWPSISERKKGEHNSLSAKT